MQAIKRCVTVPGLLLVLVLAALVVYQAVGERGAFARPTTVVTVDLAAVLDGLKQRAAAAAELDQMKAAIEAEDDRWQQILTELQTRLDEAPESEKPALRAEIARKALEYQAWGRAELEWMDREKSLRWRDLDRSIRDAIAEMARLEGYDIVLTDDSGAELGVNPNASASVEAQVKQQLNARRLLYVNPEVDVTDELIKRMNNAYSAGP